MNYPFLTQAEQIVMKAIWDLGEGSRLEFILHLCITKYNKKWKQQTISTYLKKLVDKGFISSYRNGRYIHYSINISLEDYRKELLLFETSFWYDDRKDLVEKDLFGRL